MFRRVKAQNCTSLAPYLTPNVGRRLWQIAWQWVWNLGLSLGQRMQGTEVRDSEWAPSKEAPPFLSPVEDPPEEYGPWQWAAAFGRATGRFGADAFTRAAKMESGAVHQEQICA
jgi:hypothetical protein